MFLHRSNNSRLDLNNQLTEKSVRYVRECRPDHWRWKQTLLKVLHSFRDSERQSGNILSSWLQLKTLLELLQNLNQRSRSGTSLTADWTGAASSTSSTEMSSIQEAARRALIHSGLGLLPHLQNRFDRTHSMFSESCSKGTRRLPAAHVYVLYAFIRTTYTTIVFYFSLQWIGHVAGLRFWSAGQVEMRFLVYSHRCFILASCRQVTELLCDRAMMLMMNPL